MTFETCVIRGSAYLDLALHSILRKGLEVERAARVGTVLLLTGAHPGSPLIRFLSESILEHQYDDGGWRNVEESIWTLKVLWLINDPHYQPSVERGLSWLLSQKKPGGGWGQTSRDFPRIPLTSLILFFFPELSGKDDMEWLSAAVRSEVEGEGPVLTYKLALPILAWSARGAPFSNSTAQQLYASLVGAQNHDGGFAPWKGHPVGSEPWSTAFALIALLRGSKSWGGQKAIVRALDWLAKSQLVDGSWPYHYIDEGSALAYWALVEGISWTEGRG